MIKVERTHSTILGHRQYIYNSIVKCGYSTNVQEEINNVIWGFINGAVDTVFFRTNAELHE